MSTNQQKKGLNLSSLRDNISSKLGDQKANNNKKKSSKKQTKETTTKEEKPQDEAIVREALALGASEKDLELIKDLKDDDASEQEFDDEEDAKDAEISNALQMFMKTIGLDKGAVPADVNEVEEEAEEEAEAEIEEEAEAEIEEEIEEQADEPLSSDSEEEEQQQQQEEEHESESEHETEQEKAKKGFVSETKILTSDQLLISNDSVWYDIPLDPKVIENLKEQSIGLTNEQVDMLFERGKKTLELDNQAFYDGFTKDSSQRKFMSQILSDGTLSDKISALTLLIQESPIHNTKSLETLLGYCNKKSRNSQLQSLNALKDLFLNGLLPDRKLRYFKNQPGLSMMLDKRTLALFYFEDYLKKLFFKILEILEKLSHDPIIHVRSQTLSHVFDLLSTKPEQEFNLLRLGVNKLGDIDVKVSSKASYLLLKLEQAHPNMKSVIIDSIVDLSLRPNADYHTTYYSVITLNQTILKRSDDFVANKLIKTYFTLFSKFLINTDKDEAEGDDVAIKSDAKGYEKKRKKNFKKGKNGGKSVKEEVKTESEILNEKNSKLFSALLTGINRAFPFAQLPSNVYESHLETLFKITHSANFNTSVQALVLINQVTVKAELNNDRYYRTLYESLLDQRLLNSSKQGIFLNLLYKSLKQDSKNAERVEAFVKRILQVSSHWLNIGTTAGFLFLLLQLVKGVPQIKNLLTNSPADDQYQSDNENEKDESGELKKRVYDSRKRDPRFANADKSSLWEITQFLNHFHPTVQAYAGAFVDGNTEDIAKPDLGLFTLSHFLDRFVYRNSKQKPVNRGSSIMQPLFGGSKISGSLLVKSSDAILEQTPVNTKNWLDKKINDIKPEDKFFYQYFSTKKGSIKTAKAAKQGDGFDSDDEMNEDDIWNALVKSRPDVEDDGEDDIGFDDEDLSSMSDESDGEDAALEAGLAEDDEDDIDMSAISGDDDEVDDDVFYSFADDADGANKRALEDESEGEEEEQEEQEESSNKKQKKSKKKDLPLFASADDYAKYMESDSE